MRHRVAHRKLGRVTEHRIAMIRNQATALLRHEHLVTTVPRAKELRPFVERLITVAKRGAAAGDTGAKALHARRLVLAESPRVRIDTPRVSGSINLKGARIDDLVLKQYKETVAKDSPPIRLLSPAGTTDAYFAAFGWQAAGLQPLGTQVRTPLLGASILPNDRPSDGFARGFVPHQGGFTLIGHTDGSDLLCADAAARQGFTRRVQLGVPNVPGIVLHPPRLGEMLLKTGLCRGQWVACGIKHDGSRT